MLLFFGKLLQPLCHSTRNSWFLEQSLKLAVVVRCSWAPGKSRIALRGLQPAAKDLGRFLSL